MIKIKKGMDLPIAGKPSSEVDEGKKARSVAILGDDYAGMKPTMAVAEGDSVKKGQVLFADKKTSGVVYTAPQGGRIAAINRGPKRALVSVVIDVDESTGEIGFESYRREDIDTVSREHVLTQLLQSGWWVSLRNRPFARVPDPDTQPHSIFVTAMDTNPLAADPLPVIAARQEEFDAGIATLGRLTEGAVHVCFAAEAAQPRLSANCELHEFSGPHPAGLPGTHIHYIDPVSITKSVWYVGYQDVIALGALMLTGRIDSERVISLAGPGMENPRLVKTVVGADILELTAGELKEGAQRVISGSVLSGHSAEGGNAYLGRYHNQISVIPEDSERRVLGWLRPGGNRHSVFPAFLSKWIGEKSVEFSTSTNGSTRDMVPIGTYDTVMPMDILATQLMRSLLVGDIEKSIELGCLELDEDDIALCTYACPGKYEFGPVLRDMLAQIEKEG
ncbi:MAG TPA: NADH:ubiquinone reductase (Na(+)-transporting) subunit A [Gammaproteobacteria bacterium]|nr:NADH:ubiquinone reductase (Na(+)-transporting) subunit A [Gammaproteobacteria bacterium]